MVASMEGYILQYTRVDASAPGGERQTQYVAVAESREDAFAAVENGHPVIKQVVLDWGPHVLQQARAMGVGDNEAKPL